MLTINKKILILVCILLVGVSNVYSADKKSEKCKIKKDEKIPSGVIASSGRYSQQVAVQADTGGSAPGEDTSLITGNIQGVSDSKCKAVVTNRSDCKKFSVSYEVKGGKIGQPLKNITSSSATLAPNSSKEISFNCNKLENNYQIVITKVK